MVVSDTDGRIVLVNRMLEMLAGYGSDELLGKPLEMLVPARYRTRHVVHRADYYASGLPLPDLAPAATFASP